MSRYEEPTQQVRRPQPPPAPLPGSLDPLRGQETGTGWVDTDPPDADEVPAPSVEAGATGVLPLDEIFETPREPEQVRTPTAAADAPTWTAMPVVPIRSEPLAMAGPAGTWSEPLDDAGEPRSRPPRVSAEVAWAKTRMRFEDWLRRDDNGLMLLTALVACILMIVVSGVGR